MKIVKSLEESGLVIKGVTQISKNEVKEKRGRFLGMLVGASLLVNLLTGRGTIKAGGGLIRAIESF